MKKSLILKPDLKQRPIFNNFKNQSLQVLSMNSLQLQSYLMEQSQLNPFLSVDIESLDVFSNYYSKESLSDVILRQMAYLDVPVDEDLCMYLISCLDGNGYFRYSLSDLVSRSVFSKDSILLGIEQLQKLDPIGCFCFSLSESLKVQSLMSEDVASETSYILCDHLDLLASGEFEKIASLENITVEEVKEGFAFLRELNPKPASFYASNSAFLVPEACVRVDRGNIVVELLNQDFSLKLEDMEEAVLSQELQAQRLQAKMVMDSVKRRNLTLLQILQKVCSIQRMYFLENKPLKRCTMEEVAKACDIHVSTVSRAISAKSIEFDDQYISLRSLFVRTGNSSYDASWIKMQMMQWIDNEDKRLPLSDQKIRELLLKMGVDISRRTIAKYRQEQHIETALKRRRR